MSLNTSTPAEKAGYWLLLGFSIFPVSLRKEPLCDSWKPYQDRQPTPGEIAGWCRRWPGLQWGICTGPVSNLTVVDTDSLEASATVRALLPDAPVVIQTVSPGHEQFWFQYDSDIPQTQVNKTLRPDPDDWIDIRNEGGFVLAPGSRAYRKDTEGRITTIVGESAFKTGAPGDRSKFPPELKAKLKATRPVNADGSSPPPIFPPIKDGEKIGRGQRDNVVFNKTLSMVDAGFPPGVISTAINALINDYCEPGDKPSAEAKIRAAYEYREKNPKTLPKGGIEKKAFRAVPNIEVLRCHGQDEQRWVVEGWLPEASCGLLVAPPGNYKTWLLMALTYAVATGKPFLGNYTVNGKGSVLVVQQEDPWSMLIGRLARMFDWQPPWEEEGFYRIDCRFVRELDEMSVYWHLERELNLEDAGCVARLETKIAELHPRLVTIDPLYSAISAKEYMALGAQAMLSLKRLRDKYSCSFCVAHHTTVAGSNSEDRATIWGSQFLNAWLEFGWRMPQGDNKGNIVVRHFKGSGDPKRLRLKFQITDWNFSVKVDDAPASVVDRVEEAILAGGTMREIAKEVGCSLATVSRTAKRLGVEKNDERVKQG